MGATLTVRDKSGRPVPVPVSVVPLVPEVSVVPLVPVSLPEVLKSGRSFEVSSSSLQAGISRRDASTKSSTERYLRTIITKASSYKPPYTWAVV